MKQSEKILLGILAFVCLVAGYLLLFEESATTAKVELATAQFETFAKSLWAKLDEKALTSSEQYTLDRLVAETPTSPFYVSNASFYFKEEEEQAVESNGIVYSGYLRFGDRVLAIINSIEYAVGDVLLENDMKVVSISREFVSLERVDPNTGRVSSKKIPIVEDDMEQITLRRASQ